MSLKIVFEHVQCSTCMFLGGEGVGWLCSELFGLYTAALFVVLAHGVHIVRTVAVKNLHNP